MTSKTTEQLWEDVREISQVSLEAVDPVTGLKKFLQLEGTILKVDGKEFPLADFKKTYVVGAEKAAAALAKGVEEVLGDWLSGGMINVKYWHLAQLKKVKINEAGHPLPDEAGVRGSKEIIELLKILGERDLVICLISGGGSAFLSLPIDGISLAEKQQATQLLLACGADIKEINAIRKYISQVKVGQLARLAYPATGISLILSDVIDDPLDAIASGPTA